MTEAAVRKKRHGLCGWAVAQRWSWASLITWLWALGVGRGMHDMGCVGVGCSPPVCQGMQDVGSVSVDMRDVGVQGVGVGAVARVLGAAGWAAQDGAARPPARPRYCDKVY